MRLLMLFLVLTLSGVAVARDLGQWKDVDPVIAIWYRGLMQPDNPTISCCGEADAYWADQVDVKDGKVIATITDDREDTPLGRFHVPVGTQFVIPPNKVTFKNGNPTGHVIIFLSVAGWADPAKRDVLCYVMNAGV